MVFEVRPNEDETGLKAISQLFKAFLTAQKDKFLARRSSPPLHGINLIQGDFSPFDPGEHPGQDHLKRSTPETTRVERT